MGRHYGANQSTFSLPFRFLFLFFLTSRERARIGRPASLGEGECYTSEENSPSGTDRSLTLFAVA